MHQPPGHLGGDPLAGVLIGEVQRGGLGAVPVLLGTLADLESEDVLALEGLADADDLGQVRVGLPGGEDLALQAVVAAVRAEDAVARGRHAPLGLGRDRVLGDVDALPAQFAGLFPGEEQLDGGGALAGHLLGQFMTVGACREDQRDLGPTDFRMPYGESVAALAPCWAWAIGAAASPAASSEAAARIDLALRLISPLAVVCHESGRTPGSYHLMIMSRVPCADITPLPAPRGRRQLG